MYNRLFAMYSRHMDPDRRYIHCVAMYIQGYCLPRSQPRLACISHLLENMHAKAHQHGKKFWGILGHIGSTWLAMYIGGGCAYQHRSPAWHV